MVIKATHAASGCPRGFTIDGSSVDASAGPPCPAGHTVTLGAPHADGTHQAQVKGLCCNCPLRQRCCTSKAGRILSINPQQALLAAARRAATDPAWKGEYRQ